MADYGAIDGRCLPLLPIVALALVGMVRSAENPEAAPADQAPVLPGDRGAIAARVNGVPIYEVDLEAATAIFIRDNAIDESLSDEERKKAREMVLEGLIGTELLSQKAKSVSIEVPRAELEAALSRARDGAGGDEIANQMRMRRMTEDDVKAQIEKNLTVQKFIGEAILSTVQVDEADIKRFYDEHPDEMIRPEGVEASHLFVKSPKDSAQKKAEARRRIDEALARIKAGEDFGEIARRYSDDASAEAGGFLGTIHRGQTMPAIDKVAFSLEPGAVSDVIESELGWHLIKVIRRIGPGIMDYEQAKESIREFLKQQNSQQAVKQMVDSLRAQAKVEIL